jgi:hypothetical protein
LQFAYHTKEVLSQLIRRSDRVVHLAENCERAGGCCEPHAFRNLWLIRISEGAQEPPYARLSPQRQTSPPASGC